MSNRPTFRFLFCCFTLWISIFSVRAQNDCNCTQQVVVQVNAQCSYVLTKSTLGIKNCPDSYIAVLDNKPQNRDTIDAPGSYTYGLYQNDGRLICFGNVMALSPSGPVLDSVRFVKDTFSFQKVEEVFNQPNTTGIPGSNLSLISRSTRVTNDGQFAELALDDIPNLGIPFFSMGCQTPRCGITLSFSDELVYSACRQAQQGNLYATIRRSWLARDCQGRINSSAQFIHFKNPEKRDFVWNVPSTNAREITLHYGECSLNPNIGVLDQVFPVTSERRLAVSLSGLKISQATQEKADTTCDKRGLKFIRNYLIYDECRNLIIDTFRLSLTPGPPNENWPRDQQIRDLPPLNGPKGEDKKRPDIRVFPNPGQDRIYIALPESLLPHGKIVLKDLQGRVLMRQEITSSIITLNLAGRVLNGVHLLEVHSQNQVWTQRLVVLKP